jgi:glycosyl-4,4'-diaponeurosporenoate acyltransferase
LSATGFACFLLGRIMPKDKIAWDRFPYRCMKWEKKGRFYLRFGIRKWHNRLPDMSKIIPGSMPEKAIRGPLDAEELEIMLRETCVAEFVHVLLMITGLGCLWIWPGVGGGILAACNALGNLLFVLIQRYNRPRLHRLYEKIRQEVTG